jgi:protein ImuB
VLDKLMRNTCRRMERASLGARQLDLVFERVDNSVQTIRIGTAQPSHDANHLTRLLRERFEQVDPGAGVEATRLIPTTAEPHGIDPQAYLTNVLAKIADHTNNKIDALLPWHTTA